MNHKFTIDKYQFKDNITYKELIEEYNKQFDIYEKVYSKTKRKNILLESFKKLYGMDYASIQMEIEPMYEIKYSKSKNVYTIYRMESYILSKVSDNIKLLSQNQYVQSIMPYDVNEKWQEIKIATNMAYILRDRNNINTFKNNEILIEEK
jgi:hypothetical protein